MWTALSRIFEKIGSTEMGLKFEGSVLDPDLWMGVTVACFQSVGIEPSLMLRFSNIVSGLAISWAPSFIRRAWRLVNPVDLLGFVFFSSVRTNSSLISEKRNVELDCWTWLGRCETFPSNRDLIDCTALWKYRAKPLEITFGSKDKPFAVSIEFIEFGFLLVDIAFFNIFHSLDESLLFSSIKN